MPVLYRIVRTNPPQRSDFESKEEQGVPPPDDDPETRRLWSGVSMYERLSQARRKARGRPWHGRGFIAACSVSESGPCRYQRTTRSAGHFTVWCDADFLLNASMTSLVPVES